MEDNKQWYKSKGVWGGIIAVCAGLAGAFFGMDIMPETQEQLAYLVSTLAGTVGGFFAIVGRLTAKDKID